MDKTKNKYQNIFYIILLAVLILCFTIVRSLEIKTYNKIVENRNNYEMFDKCHLIEEKYYCEKTN